MQGIFPFESFDSVCARKCIRNLDDYVMGLIYTAEDAYAIDSEWSRIADEAEKLRSLLGQLVDAAALPSPIPSVLPRRMGADEQPSSSGTPEETAIGDQEDEGNPPW